MNRILRLLSMFATALALLACGAAAAAVDTPASTDDVVAAEQARRERLRAYVPGAGHPPGGRGLGELRFRILTYVRYLNQSGLDDSYTDSFGTTRTLDPRQDMQLNKMNFYFSGWFMDPRLHYIGYVWTSNPSQGLGAQVVVAGNVGYRFSAHFDVGGGIGGLPGTRTVEGNWPLWLSVDNRLIADEYFRPSYTSGIWSRGRIVDRVKYWVMLGNNLSQLGVDAGQLDDTFDTWSGVVTWMPTTGEFGTGSGFGDFDHHEQVATRFGLHYTRSTENRQSQPSTEAPRTPRSGSRTATSSSRPACSARDRHHRRQYRMVAVDAGVKYQAWPWRARSTGAPRTSAAGHRPLGFTELSDRGYQVQASAMVMPRSLQAYLGRVDIDGEYGDPWDARVGLNWYPWPEPGRAGQWPGHPHRPVAGRRSERAPAGGRRGTVVDANSSCNSEGCALKLCLLIPLRSLPPGGSF